MNCHDRIQHWSRYGTILVLFSLTGCHFFLESNLPSCTSHQDCLPSEQCIISSCQPRLVDPLVSRPDWDTRLDFNVDQDFTVGDLEVETQDQTVDQFILDQETIDLDLIDQDVIKDDFIPLPRLCSVQFAQIPFPSSYTSRSPKHLCFKDHLILFAPFSEEVERQMQQRELAALGGQMGGQSGGQMGGQSGGQMGGQTAGSSGGQAGGTNGGQMDEPIGHQEGPEALRTGPNTLYPYLYVPPQEENETGHWIRLCQTAQNSILPTIMNTGGLRFTHQVQFQISPSAFAPSSTPRIQFLDPHPEVYTDVLGGKYIYSFDLESQACELSIERPGLSNLKFEESHETQTTQMKLIRKHPNNPSNPNSLVDVYYLYSQEDTSMSMDTERGDPYGSACYLDSTRSASKLTFAGPWLAWYERKVRIDSQRTRLEVAIMQKDQFTRLPNDNLFVDSFSECQPSLYFDAGFPSFNLTQSSSQLQLKYDQKRNLIYCSYTQNRCKLNQIAPDPTLGIMTQHPILSRASQNDPWQFITLDLPSFDLFKTHLTYIELSEEGTAPRFYKLKYLKQHTSSPQCGITENLCYQEEDTFTSAWRIDDPLLYDQEDGTLRLVWSELSLVNQNVMWTLRSQVLTDDSPSDPEELE